MVGNIAHESYSGVFFLYFCIPPFLSYSIIVIARGKTHAYQIAKHLFYAQMDISSTRANIMLQAMKFNGLICALLLQTKVDAVHILFRDPYYSAE